MRLSHFEVTEVEPAVVKLTVSVPPEEVRSTLRHLMNQLRRLIYVRGFRPGKAPDAIIRKHVGDENIRSRLLEELLSRAYEEAVSKGNLYPLMVQRLQLRRFAEDEGLEFEAEVAVRGKIELGDYRSIRVKEREIEVTEEDIEAALERLRERFPRYELEEGRHAQHGDRVKLRYRITPAGEDEGEERTTLITAGQGYWFPPFNEYVLGKRAGDEGEVEITFPDDFPNERLAGKNCKVWFSVEAVEARRLPELNDEFARMVGGFDTLEELKEELREEIWLEKEREAERETRRQVEDELLRICSVTIPRSFIESLSEDAVKNTVEQLRRDGIPIQVWEQMTHRSLEDFRREAMEGGERTLKLRFLLEEIAKREEIDVSDEEIKAYVAALIERSGRGADEIEEGELERLIASARWQLLREKVMDFLVELATRGGEGADQKSEGEESMETGEGNIGSDG
ncbi:MAG: trigger factor [Armatimonadota bacterium]|nr:trigger factor [Armatimonadota bacterium]MCX7777012.1 trigger factor [Armatimonadota bacterium]MDW8024920.1 trigger factor [Armatimonadota bacterium]